MDYPHRTSKKPQELCEQLKSQFEGREAIYVEKGYCRARISQITPNVAARRITAKVEVIPTEGIIHRYPPFWDIGGGSMTSFSDNSWKMGYGGWSIFFDPGLIREVCQFSAKLPSEMPWIKRYNRIMLDLINARFYSPARNVFPESELAMMSGNEFAQALKRLLRSARLINWPRRPQQRELLVTSVAIMFQAGRTYTEKEVNDTILEWLGLVGNAVQIDHANIRRELVDKNLLERDKAGTSYSVGFQFSRQYGESFPETDIRRLLS